MDFIEYHEEPVRLHSGGYSHYLVRGDLMFQDKRLREAVLDFWISKLPYRPITLNSVPSGGTLWAEALGDRIDTLRHQGHWPEQVVCSVVVDDVVTTGASLHNQTYQSGWRKLAVVDRRPPTHREIPGHPNEIISWMQINLPIMGKIMGNY